MSIGALLIRIVVKALRNVPVLSDNHDVAQLAELPKKIIPARACQLAELCYKNLR